jgi:hypothetical protein
MRQKTRKPIDEMQVDQGTLEANSRDDIPQLLKGLQYIFGVGAQISSGWSK